MVLSARIDDFLNMKGARDFLRLYLIEHKNTFFSFSSKRQVLKANGILFNIDERPGVANTAL